MSARSCAAEVRERARARMCRKKVRVNDRRNAVVEPLISPMMSDGYPDFWRYIRARRFYQTFTRHSFARIRPREKRADAIPNLEMSMTYWHRARDGR